MFEKLESRCLAFWFFLPWKKRKLPISHLSWLGKPLVAQDAMHFFHLPSSSTGGMLGMQERSVWALLTETHRKKASCDPWHCLIDWWLSGKIQRGIIKPVTAVTEKTQQHLVHYDFTNFICKGVEQTNELCHLSRKNDSSLQQHAASISSNSASVETFSLVKPHSVAHIYTYHTHIWPVAWSGACLTLENNGMSSWPRSRVWRVYSAGVGVSNVARAVWMWPGAWVGPQEVCLPARCARPSRSTRGVMNYLSGSSLVVMSTLGRLLWCFCGDVMIKCESASCGEFISTELARGVARKTPERILLWVWDHFFFFFFK